MAGRQKYFRSEWEKIKSDKVIHIRVSHWHIEFDRDIPVQNGTHKHGFFSDS